MLAPNHITGSSGSSGSSGSRFGANPTVACLALVAALGGSFTLGCGAVGSDRSRDQRGMIDALTSARDAVCGCRDLTCAEHAEQRLADYLLRHVDRLKKVPAPAPGRTDTLNANATQAAQLDGELRACKHRLEEAARAS